MGSCQDRKSPRGKRAGQRSSVLCSLLSRRPATLAKQGEEVWGAAGSHRRHAGTLEAQAGAAGERRD